MLRRAKWLKAVGASTVLVLLLGANDARRPDQLDGDEWIAWTQGERNAYVIGSIEGYWRASHDACRLADDLFEVGKRHRLGQEPSGRCQNHLENYSKMRMINSSVDVCAYTSVITEFYGKHPEFRNIPKGYLMSFLTDQKYKTADQLSEMAMRKEIHTQF